MNIRKAAMAGRFYPAKKEELLVQLGAILEKEMSAVNLGLKSRKIIGGIVPHAAFMFSAYEAVHFFEILRQSKQPVETIIIINPNHTGLGHEMAIDPHDFWETPLGLVPVDKEFVANVGLQISGIEQKHEHSCEVMLPLIQYFLHETCQIVPITLSRQTFRNAKYIADRVFETATKLNRKVLILASSDFSHFLSPETGAHMDKFVLDKIKSFDSKGLEDEVRTKNISVCGFGPIMALVEYSKLVSKKPENIVLKKGHSGKIIPSEEVVDYISVLFTG